MKTWQAFAWVHIMALATGWLGYEFGTREATIDHLEALPMCKVMERANDW